MSCYHPLIGYRSDTIAENGKRKIKIISLRENETIDDFKSLGVFLIPCGRCIGCRLDYSRKWADRMMLELETAKKGIFVTLTYDNDHMHINEGSNFGTLDKRDCQLFMKRLRKEFEHRIRFFLAGEYGEHTLRPHYHAIIYGLGLSDIGDCKLYSRNDLGQPYYISKRFQKVWSLGNVLLADVSWETCAYVARYVVKKQTGDKANIYDVRGVIPEFCLMSRRPGIGADYLAKHPDCLDFQSINLSTPNGGLKISIPKYYLKKYESTNPYDYAKMMEQRRKFSCDNNLLELQGTEKTFEQYLKVKESNKLEKMKALKRKV